MAKAKKATKAAAPKAAAASNEMLLVASKVRAAVKAADCNFAGDAIEALNGYVGWLIQQATKRAKENGRKTVRGHDFMVM